MIWESGPSHARETAMAKEAHGDVSLPHPTTSVPLVVTRMEACAREQRKRRAHSPMTPSLTPTLLPFIPISELPFITDDRSFIFSGPNWRVGKLKMGRGTFPRKKSRHLVWISSDSDRQSRSSVSPKAFYDVRTTKKFGLF